MFGKHSSAGFNETSPGNRIKTLCYGEHTLLVEVHLDKDADLLRHKHPYEQTGYLISGNIRMHIEEKEMELEPIRQYKDAHRGKRNGTRAWR